MTDGARQAKSEFTYGYWLNGWRKQEDNTSSDTLCLETGTYGLTLDVANLPAIRFGTFRDSPDYDDALMAGLDRLRKLDPAELNINVKVGGRVFRAVSSRAGNSKSVKRLRAARLWESGRLVQHFDLLDLVLQDQNGHRLKCDANLELVAWPDSLAVTTRSSSNTSIVPRPAQVSQAP